MLLFREKLIGYKETMSTFSQLNYICQFGWASERSEQYPLYERYRKQNIRLWVCLTKFRTQVLSAKYRSFYKNIKRTPSIKYTSWRLLFTEQKLLPRVETRVWTQRLTALVLITETDKPVERTRLRSMMTDRY